MSRQSVSYWIDQLKVATAHIEGTRPKLVERRTPSGVEKWTEYPRAQVQRSADVARSIIQHLHSRHAEMTPDELRGFFTARRDHARALRPSVRRKEDIEAVDRMITESQDVLELMDRARQ